MDFIISIVVAYLLGSVSTSILLAKFLKKPDPRTQGSGNAGATNVLRVMGKHEALCVLVGDALKGFIAIMLGRVLGVEGLMLGFLAVGVVAGHIFPVFFGFKGGKGVATAIGATLGLSLWIGVVMIIAWIAVAYVMKYASLASLVAVALAPIGLLVFGNRAYAFPALIMAGLVIWKHMDNIKRLQAVNEDKIDIMAVIKVS